MIQTTKFEGEIQAIIRRLGKITIPAFLYNSADCSDAELSDYLCWEEGKYIYMMMMMMKAYHLLQ
jgi:hypothetical protein